MYGALMQTQITLELQIYPAKQHEHPSTVLYCMWTPHQSPLRCSSRSCEWQEYHRLGSEFGTIEKYALFLQTAVQGISLCLSLSCLSHRVLTALSLYYLCRDCRLIQDKWVILF